MVVIDYKCFEFYVRSQSGTHVLARHTFEADASYRLILHNTFPNLTGVAQHATLSVAEAAVTTHDIAVIRHIHRAEFPRQNLDIVKLGFSVGIMPGPRKRPYSNIDFTLRKVFKKAAFRQVF